MPPATGSTAARRNGRGRTCGSPVSTARPGPCLWSAPRVAGGIGKSGQLPLVLALFLVGAFVMRGAGCTWNDITDRDLDALVERTRSRPIPAGQGPLAPGA